VWTCTGRDNVRSKLWTPEQTNPPVEINLPTQLNPSTQVSPSAHVNQPLQANTPAQVNQSMQVNTPMQANSPEQVNPCMEVNTPAQVNQSIPHHHHHHNRFTALFPRPPGWLVPEENFWTLWCKEDPHFLQAGCCSCRPTNSVKAPKATSAFKGRLTEADTLTIRLGTTPSGPTSAYLHHPPIFFTGWMPFLPPNQQHQSTEGKIIIDQCKKITNFKNMLLSNRVSMVEHKLGKQRCTRPHKQAVGDIDDLPITEITY